jgi:tRNA pseudouridine38-40 synthase
MVRRVVGCLVGVGRGEITREELLAFFVAPSPYPARVTAPPSGLFLEEVIYPGEAFRRPLAPVLAVERPAPPAVGARAPATRRPTARAARGS